MPQKVSRKKKYVLALDVGGVLMDKDKRRGAVISCFLAMIGAIAAIRFLRTIPQIVRIVVVTRVDGPREFQERLDWFEARGFFANGVLKREDIFWVRYRDQKGAKIQEIVKQTKGAKRAILIDDQTPCLLSTYRACKKPILIGFQLKVDKIKPEDEIPSTFIDDEVRCFANWYETCTQLASLFGDKPPRRKNYPDLLMAA